METTDNFIWERKYAPKSLKDIIIPERLKEEFSKYIEAKEFPNLLFYSQTPGSGKSSSANCICNDIGIKPLVINASLNNSINDVRTTIIQYATTKSMFSDAKKVIVFEEFSNFSTQGMDSLKALMDEVSGNCRMIATCNSLARIPEPILSRFQISYFDFSEKELKPIKAKMFKRCQEILDIENVPYKNEVLAQLVAKYVPDNRKLLNILQQFSNQYNAIDEGALGVLNTSDTKALMDAMKNGKYGVVKDWVFNSSDSLSDDFYMKIFKTMEPLIVPQNIPQIILTLGEYQKYHSVVPDRTIHFLAMMTEIMQAVQFKGE